MSGHTPGPWFTVRPIPYGTIYVEARIGGGMLQEVAACGPTEGAGQQEANARLIAAAPELLHCLKVIVCHAEGLDVGAALHLDKAMEAIAKAEGDV